MNGDEIKKYGPWLSGKAGEYDIPNKAVADQARIHESTVSRFFNGIKPVSLEQFGKLCYAVGELKSQHQQQQKAA